MNTLCLLIYPLVTFAMVGFVSSVMTYRWLGQSRQAGEIDRSARLLVYLLLLAALSLGAFLMYIFFHVRAC
jgi:hypothetical protein